MVKRFGVKLANVLTKANPCKGEDILHGNCLLCQTKMRTGKKIRQDISQRSVVYETRFLNC